MEAHRIDPFECFKVAKGAGFELVEEQHRL
jgi:hypothetical protein